MALVFRYFILVFFNNLLSIGILSIAATKFTGLTEVSNSVAFTTVGTLLSFLILNLSKFWGHKFHLPSGAGLRLFFLPLATGSLALLPSFSMVWYLSILLIYAITSYENAELLASIGKYEPNVVQVLNKRVQQGGVLGSMTGVSLGPIAALLPFQNFVAVIIFFALAYSLLSIKKTKPSEANSAGKNQNEILHVKETFKQSGMLKYVIGITFLWFTVGFFNVIEIPILKARFGMESTGISAAFLLTLGCNLIPSLLIPGKFFGDHHKRIFIFTCIGLFAVGPLYAINTNLNFIFPLLAIFGLLNGAFNLAYTSKVNAFPEHNLRITTYFLIRACTQTSILLSAIIASSYSIDSVTGLMIKVSAVFAILISLLFLK